MKMVKIPRDRIPSPESASLLERSRDVLLAQWKELLRLRRSVLKTSDLDDIHDLRVASRRFRAAVGLFSPLTRTGPVPELKKGVRKLTRALGGLRNIDEALLFFQSRTPQEITADNRLCSILPKRRARELARTHKALKAFDHKHLGRQVRKIAAKLCAGRIRGSDTFSLQACFSEASVGLFQPIHDLVTSATVPEHRESRHALRIAIKKWRYFLEIASPVLDSDHDAVLGLLKEYQTILGRMNDVAEFGVLSRSLKLSPTEHEHIERILLAEDRLLLKQFTALVKRKPLRYTFLV